MKANLLPLLALALLLAQCKKTPDTTPPIPTDPLAALPAETQTGAGTFGCLVNSKPYATVSSIKCRGDWQGIKTIFISAGANANAQYSGEPFSASMLLNGVAALQNNQQFDLVTFSQPINQAYNQFAANAVASNRSCVYQGNYIKTGQVTLTKFDGPNRIASGRFAFTLYEPGGCDTLKVTNGRFDVKF
jgi:hypothetical protein